MRNWRGLCFPLENYSDLRNVPKTSLALVGAPPFRRTETTDQTGTKNYHVDWTFIPLSQIVESFREALILFLFGSQSRPGRELNKLLRRSGNLSKIWNIKSIDELSSGRNMQRTTISTCWYTILFLFNREETYMLGWREPAHEKWEMPKMSIIKWVWTSRCKKVDGYAVRLHFFRELKLSFYWWSK